MVRAGAQDRVDGARDDRAAVDKAISLLTAFGSQAATGLGVSELARRASLSKSTAFRVLAMLERNGVVERVDREYRLGAQLHELGRAVYSPDHDRLCEELTPFLTDLYEATHETVHLAALHGSDVVYLAKLYGHRRVSVPSKVGGRVPAYATAVGKVLLAYDPGALDMTMSRRLAPLTTATVRDHQALCDQLAQVRRDGLAFESEESSPGVCCLAAPIMGGGGRPVAAMSVAMPSSNADLRAVAGSLRVVAAEASRGLRRRRAVGRTLIGA